MRISDWSSDVCSSDLVADLVELRIVQRQRAVGGKRIGGGSGGGLVGHGGVLGVGWRSNGHGNGQRSGEGMLHRGNTSSNGTPKPTRPTIPPTHDQRHTPAPHTGARPPTAPLDPANLHHRPVAPLPQSGRGAEVRVPLFAQTPTTAPQTSNAAASSPIAEPQTLNAGPPTPTHGAFFAIAEAPNPNAALRYPIDAPKRGATETPNLSSDASSLNDAPFRCVVPPPNIIAVAFLIIGSAQPMPVAIARTASRTSAPSTAPDRQSTRLTSNP